MLGAIIGDTVGSIYEGHNIDTTEFPFFVERSHFTDDSVMTIAVAEWLLNDPARSQQGLEQSLVKWGHKYPHAGYGGGFSRWLSHPEFLYTYRDPSSTEDTSSASSRDSYNFRQAVRRVFKKEEAPATASARHPYNSYGNGSAMRASACGWLAHSLDEALDLGKRSAIITHNHPEGVKGAQAVATAIYLARTGATKEQIRQYIEDTFAYDLSHSCDEIRPEYYFDPSCQGTMPAALAAFFDSHDFESAVRLAVSLGGDSDTIACITGGIAEAFYHDIPAPIIDEMHRRLPDEFWSVINALYAATPTDTPYIEPKPIQDSFNLNRFLLAQEDTYPMALAEMSQGSKRNHWIWYIFPQVAGLGHSDMSRQYAIHSLDEARAYLLHPVLGTRLREITRTVCTHTDKSAQDIFGSLDAMKFRSSMTLFDQAEPDSVFAEALRLFFGSEPDTRTLCIIQSPTK